VHAAGEEKDTPRRFLFSFFFFFLFNAIASFFSSKNKKRAMANLSTPFAGRGDSSQPPTPSGPDLARDAAGDAGAGGTARAGAGASVAQPPPLHRVASAAPPLPFSREPSSALTFSPRAGGEDGTPPTFADFAGAGPAAEAALRDAAARHAAALAALDRLRATAKTFEREHDFVATGMEGWAALLSALAFLATWVAGLGGASQLATLRGNDARVDVAITVAGLTGGVVTAWARLWAPAVRATYYKNARDAYARVRKRAKATAQAAAGAAARAGGASGSDDATATAAHLAGEAAGLEAAARSLEARLDDLYDACPDIPIDRDGFEQERGRAGLDLFLSFGALFAPCAACCGQDSFASSKPPKPADARPRREEAWV
jgi:hypothetical protein